MREILEADNLATLINLRHGFFTREQGNGGFSGQKNADDVYRNRRRMAEHLQVKPEHLLTAYQTHSAHSVTLEGLPWGEESRPEADALVSAQDGFAVGVLTADCVPVLLAAHDGRKRADIVAAAHAGWRGALTGILEATVKRMEQKGARPQDMVAALGPCIWQRSYEVGSEFPAAFLAQDARHERFFVKSAQAGHYLFDLPGYVIERLRRIGITNIAPSPADTFAEPDHFFSHRYSTLRKEKRQGNLMSAISLPTQGSLTRSSP